MAHLIEVVIEILSVGEDIRTEKIIVRAQIHTEEDHVRDPDHLIEIETKMTVEGDTETEIIVIDRRREATTIIVGIPENDSTTDL